LIKEVCRGLERLNNVEQKKTATDGT